MARKKSHKDVEFAVDLNRHEEKTFKTFDEAASFAVARAASNGLPTRLNVLIYSKAGARWYGGDEAVEQYEEDPEASVSDSYEIKVNALGRIA